MKNAFFALVALLAFLSVGCIEEGPRTESPVLTYSQDLSKGNGPVDCSLVLCFAVECPDGFERKYTPNNCCGTCVQKKPNGEGTCNNAKQCDGLVHIECVGAWTCENHACSYTCDTTEPVSY